MIFLSISRCCCSLPWLLQLLLLLLLYAAVVAKVVGVAVAAAPAAVLVAVALCWCCGCRARCSIQIMASSGSGPVWIRFCGIGQLHVSMDNAHKFDIVLVLAQVLVLLLVALV